MLRYAALALVLTLAACGGDGRSYQERLEASRAQRRADAAQQCEPMRKHGQLEFDRCVQETYRAGIQADVSALQATQPLPPMGPSTATCSRVGATSTCTVY